jgi:hypothetical protein
MSFLMPLNVNNITMFHYVKNTETLIDSSMAVGLEVNIEKTKYMLLSRHENAVQNQDIKTANRSCENVARLKYL